MRTHLLIVTAIFLGVSLLPVPLSAQDPHQEAIAAAMSVLDDFMLYFNRRDQEARASTLNYPHVRFAAGNVTILESAEDFVTNARNFNNLPRTGWDHSHWHRKDVTLASPDKVHIETVVQRFNSSNELIVEFQSLYIVTNVDGHWGIQARSSLAPPPETMFLDRAESPR